MYLQTLMETEKISPKRLSKLAGVPYSTVLDLVHGKTAISKCNVETAYKLAKTLGVTIDELVYADVEKRGSFENFKSNVCHELKRVGDREFIRKINQSDEIFRYEKYGWYPEMFYLLGMVDYLSRENKIPLEPKFAELRTKKLAEPIYPESIRLFSMVMKRTELLEAVKKDAIPEFAKYNILEGNVRDAV